MTQSGFTIAHAWLRPLSTLSLGGVLSVTGATDTAFTLNNIAYIYGGALSGQLGFNAITATLSLGTNGGGSAIVLASSALTGNYDFGSGALNVMLASFSVSIGGFVNLSATNVGIYYLPTSGGNSTFLVGVKGATVFLGSGTVGVQISAGTLALAVFDNSGTVTFAFSASGAVSLVGLSAGTLSLSGNISALFNNTGGAVNQTINVDSTPADAVTLSSSGNTRTLTGSGLTLSVGNFVTVTGDFGFDTQTANGITTVGVAAENVSATMTVGTASLNISGASLGLLLVTASSGTPAVGSYVLIANGGTDTLSGVADVSLAASGLQVMVNNTGVTPTSANLPMPSQGITTPDGSLSLAFSAFSASTNVEDIQGSITLDIGTSISVDDTFTASSSNSVTLTQNPIPGAPMTVTVGGTSTTAYTVGTTTTNGVTTSVILFNAPQTGAVSVTYMAVSKFISLSGSFEFQEMPASGTPTEIIVGATSVDAAVSTATVNLTITGASLGLVIVPGTNAYTTKFALVSSSGMDNLTGVPGVTVSVPALSAGLTIEANDGVSSTVLSGVTSITTPGGTFTPNWPAMGTTRVMGTINVSIAGFVSLNGSFSFTEQPDPTKANVTDILVGASGVTAFLGTTDSSGNPSIGVEITNAELGLVIYSSSVSNTTTYALSASAQITGVGLPSDVSFSTGTVSVQINNTGGSVNQMIATPDSTVTVSFVNGSNVESVSAQNLTLNIGSPTLFSLSGSFSFTEDAATGLTEIEIGATGVTGSGITPTGGAASVTISNGSLGLVIFINTSGASPVNEGYALTGSATITAGITGLSASATLSIRRNTTTNAVNVVVNVANQSTINDSFTVSAANSVTLTQNPISGAPITVTLNSSPVSSANYTVQTSTTAGVTTTVLHFNSAETGTIQVSYSVMVSASVPVTFSATEIYSSGSAFQQISVSNVTVTSSNALIQFVATTLAGILTGSIDETVSPTGGSASIGNFLVLNSVSLVINATETAGVWSGTASVTAGSGTLFPGNSFSATLTNITGTYTLNAQSPTVPITLTVGGFNLSVGKALLITASGVTIDYDPNALPNQQLAMVTGATVTSPNSPRFQLQR